MEIRFHNTLSHRTETFAPLDPPHVYMYNCGPTVYDFAHIGNFRTFLFADVLRRFLELAGYQVHQVMNLTDVGHMTEDDLADGGGEDKMALAGRRIKEAKKSGTLAAGAVDDPDNPHQVADFYIRAFLEDAKALGLRIADDPPLHRPRATDHVQQMLELVAALLDKGHAYVASDGCAYFSVQTFPEYGRLSGNTLENLRGGAGGRVLDEHQALKKHPADFLLWKPDPKHLMKWDPRTLAPGTSAAALGEGYPGWHIECSAMSLHVLSQLAGKKLSVIDIHTGGEDNIFPHHECEIAQSAGAADPAALAAAGDFRGFARFWMHSRHLLVNGQKMSKRQGTFYTVRDVLEGGVTGRPVDPAVLRFELIKGHYRSNLNFTAQGLQDSASAVQRLRDARAKATGRAPQKPLDIPVVREFTDALADDLEIARATGTVFAWLRDGFAATLQDGEALYWLDQVVGFGAAPQARTLVATEVPVSRDRPLGLAVEHVGSGELDVVAICRALDAARRAKDFATADRLRQELIDAGYDVQTTKAGTVARKKLA